MRLWSIEFSYLDSKGIVALWREALLAKKVLEGKTKGYKNHPQLDRFKETKNPLKTINTYLRYVYEEARQRGYRFEEKKIEKKLVDKKIKIKVTSGQVTYEFNHLLKKLELREVKQYNLLKDKKQKKCCPLFVKEKGPIESWEVIEQKERQG